VPVEKSENVNQRDNSRLRTRISRIHKRQFDLHPQSVAGRCEKTFEGERISDTSHQPIKFN